MTVNLVGYSDQIVAEPGERLQFMVSARAATFRADLVRLYHGDCNPEGPGLREVAIEHDVSGDYAGTWQELRAGSYIVVPNAPVLALDSFSIHAWVWPTSVGDRRQAVISNLDPDGASGYGLLLTEDGAVELRIGSGDRSMSLRTRTPLRERTWYLVACTYDRSSSLASVHQIPGDRRLGKHRTSITSRLRAHSPTTSLDLLVAGIHTGSGPRGCFNGKLQDPQISNRALPLEELERRARMCPSEGVTADVVAAWDFADGPSGDVVLDRGPNHLDGAAVQHPARGMTGWNWDGTALDHTKAPARYGAIHFHEDDLTDARWDPSVDVTLPADLPSGVYALRLRSEDGFDHVPFVVRPPAGRPTARIAVLLPTYSYLAYANFRGSADPAVDEYIVANGLLSLYDLHRDGSGTCYSSRLRPNLTLRPTARLDLPHIEQPGGFPHQFPADLYLIDWLDRFDYSVDVLTDEVLHGEGADLLEPYRVVMTGTHPEYCSAQMLDALDGYLSEGGRLMYLGGNGFYWVTSCSPTDPHVIEVRRTSGTRAWEAQPGEGYHSTTGEPGGLWRHRGRAPQCLVGVGFTAQGFTGGGPYRRSETTDPYAAMVFAGLPEQQRTIGDHGCLVLGHGAAGFELDRADVFLGTPADSVVLASSCSADYSPSYQHVVEEVMMSDSSQAAPDAPQVRADLTLVPYPNGGAVFSVGSVAWCGGLSANDYDNDVSLVTGNVLDAFVTLDELPWKS